MVPAKGERSLTWTLRGERESRAETWLSFSFSFSAAAVVVEEEKLKEALGACLRAPALLVLCSADRAAAAYRENELDDLSPSSAASAAATDLR